MNSVFFLYFSVFLSVTYFSSLVLIPSHKLHDNKLTRFFAPWLIKGLSTFLLGTYVLYSLPNKTGLLVFISFVFAAIGDMFLAIDKKKLFMHGLISFLGAHFLYIFVFISQRQTIFYLPEYKIFLLIAFLIATLFTLWRLFPHLGQLKTGVTFYILILTLMGLSAISAKFLTPLVLVGALLFCFSDSLIAVEKFLKPFKGIGYLIWICYYVGQLCIALGVTS